MQNSPSRQNEPSSAETANRFFCFCGEHSQRDSQYSRYDSENYLKLLSKHKASQKLTVIKSEKLDDINYQKFTEYKFVFSKHLLEIKPESLDLNTEYLVFFNDLTQDQFVQTEEMVSGLYGKNALNWIATVSKKIVGWKGMDRRTVPETSKKLYITMIRDDWLPTEDRDMDLVNLRIDAGPQALFKEKHRIVKYMKFMNRCDQSKLHSYFLVTTKLLPSESDLLNMALKHAYYIPALLTAAKLCERSNQLNNGLINKALFAFERTTISEFQLGDANIRLPFEFLQNRLFCITLIRYIFQLKNMGLFETGLNFAKLLFSLNPTLDPYGVRHFIDEFAILAKNYQFLTNFYESTFVNCYDFWYTPSLCFSSALAYYKLNKIIQAKQAIYTGCQFYPTLAIEILREVAKVEEADFLTCFEGKDALFKKYYLSHSMNIVIQHYLSYVKEVWKEREEIQFLKEIILNFFNFPKFFKVIQEYQDNDQFKNTPKQILRVISLKQCTRAFLKVPQKFWNEFETSDIDILPPETSYTETIENLCDINHVRDLLKDHQNKLIEEERMAEEQ